MPLPPQTRPTSGRRYTHPSPNDLISAAGAAVVVEPAIAADPDRDSK